MAHAYRACQAPAPQADVLLLDEPTNHLDIESIQWLENFIATRANAVILVSHDRAFIDNTTFRTIEIELGKIYDYKVKYSEYVELRKERREQQLRAFENQQKKLADTEASSSVSAIKRPSPCRCNPVLNNWKRLNA